MELQHRDVTSLGTSPSLPAKCALHSHFPSTSPLYFCTPERGSQPAAAENPGSDSFCYLEAPSWLDCVSSGRSSLESSTYSGLRPAAGLRCKICELRATFALVTSGCTLRSESSAVQRRALDLPVLATEGDLPTPKSFVQHVQ
jgi:hypothetical protein